jgi:hypothetical protein
MQREDESHGASVEPAILVGQIEAQEANPMWGEI